MLSDTEQADGMKTKEHRQTGRRQRERERKGRRERGCVEWVWIKECMDR